MATGEAVAIEALRADIAQAKEQARVINAAALKAAKDLKAEHADGPPRVGRSLGGSPYANGYDCRENFLRHKRVK